MNKSIRVKLMLSLCAILILGVASLAFAAYNESPVLAELVKEGKLPPVEERLPKNPLVVKPGVLAMPENVPDFQVGTYGGTLRSVHHAPEWNPDFYIANIEPLVAVIGEGVAGTGVHGIQAGVVDEWDVSEDNRVFTFHIREGLKWSDGHPVTTEDVLFAYEDILLNETLTPVFPVKLRAGYRSDGSPMKLEVIDDYTFRVSFDEPYGGFLLQLAINQWGDYADFLIKPKHYLKQFHIKYTSLDEMRPYLDELELDDEWWQLFWRKDILSNERGHRDAIGCPMLTAWVLSEASTQNMIIMERNPYYFKVDEAGNQLPYIDTISSQFVQDIEMMNVKVSTGEVDFMRENTALEKMPFYKANEQRGGFRAYLVDHHLDPSTLEFNFTYEDPVWREVLGDARFRQAINMGINRDEIISSVYFGFGGVPESGAPYDPDRANALLDAMGMDKRDRDGYRLAPNGEPFSILFEVGTFVSDLVQAGELVVENLADLGIKAMVKPIEVGLWGQRIQTNELQATIMWGRDLGQESPWPWDPNEIIPLYWQWYVTGGKQGEEPPAWIKKGFQINEKIWASLPGSDEYDAMKAEKLAWEQEFLPVISLVGQAKHPIVTSARLRNVPTSGRDIAVNYAMEQFFFVNE